jgi:hypothetical protein
MERKKERKKERRRSYNMNVSVVHNIDPAVVRFCQNSEHNCVLALTSQWHVFIPQVQR